jgi:AcrR family transcriptional regulator
MAGEADGSLRAVRSWPQADALERRLLEAVLACVGESGYPQTTMGAVIERAGASNRAFHRHFASLEECFAEAYELAAEELCAQLIAIGRAERSWRAGLRAALAWFLRFVAEQPQLARVVVLEYQFAGEEAIRKHTELIGRLCAELDRVRSEPGERQLPQATAQMALGAIEFGARVAIVREETAKAEEMLDGLDYFVALLYLGREAAEEGLGGEGR